MEYGEDLEIDTELWRDQQAEQAAAALRSPPELQYTDVTLRALSDGAAFAAHRGVLAKHSVIFCEVLAGCTQTSPFVIPLPGKSAADLRLLSGYLYPERARNEHFSAENVERACHLADEYNIDGMLHAARDWITANFDELAVMRPQNYPLHGGGGYMAGYCGYYGGEPLTMDEQNLVVRHYRTMALAKKLNFGALAQRCKDRWQKQPVGWARVATEITRAYALEILDNDLLLSLV